MDIRQPVIIKLTTSLGEMGIVGQFSKNCSMNMDVMKRTIETHCILICLPGDMMRPAQLLFFAEEIIQFRAWVEKNWPGLSYNILVK